MHRNTFTSARHFYVPILPSDELMVLLQLNESQYCRIPATEIARASFSNRLKMTRSYLTFIKGFGKSDQYDSVRQFLEAQLNDPSLLRYVDNFIEESKNKTPHELTNFINLSNHELLDELIKSFRPLTEGNYYLFKYIMESN